MSEVSESQADVSDSNVQLIPPIQVDLATYIPTAEVAYFDAVRDYAVSLAQRARDGRTSEVVVQADVDKAVKRLGSSEKTNWLAATRSWVQGFAFLMVGLLVPQLWSLFSAKTTPSLIFTQYTVVVAIVAAASVMAAVVLESVAHYINRRDLLGPGWR